MKTIWKAAIAAVTVGLAAGCQPYDGYYDNGYGYGGGYGYCDSFGCPGNYWDLPVYYGSVYYGGRWSNGPFYYRDYNGGRQYWMRGGWRNDDWRGDRPSQYRDGRYGPPLGRDFYRNRQNVNGNNGGGRGNFRNDDGPRQDRGDRGGRNNAPPPDRFQRDRPAAPPPPPASNGERRGGRAAGIR